ncbi:signal transduction histidine kinase [Breznakia sp. PF5-3]|uniref:HAMP domain-containing sensor histidine kinase n=1 Tax=unclassified Breznakia TaxID=2623764 RepID=UPI002405B217|nr:MULTISPECIES: HAMP domain-containing sensor histidine kinase [unclassified Breznakia]MDF9825087.1 signal transduction histidine kinase [Breznakia sp. PM6-1]MDF9835936.1 signal transduction histidine kinase [Breznakia sp. PF5-3]MDF9837462.1 signal transduction histidine kinase [Breznakia sp. PFB2-8]MDF9859475.1 signal transduction histidine kinase [Breznakia sp. PH5-24]
MKLKKMKLRTKVFAYILIFAMIIIALLWVFQIVFLDDFYKMIKTRQIQSTVDEIADHIQDNVESNEMESFLYSTVINGEYCIQVWEKDSEANGKEYYTRLYQDVLTNPGICGYQNDTSISVEDHDLYMQASENDGEATMSSSNSISLPSGVKIKNDFDGITVGRIIYTEDDTKYFLIVNSRISPVNETVDTLVQQLGIITTVLLLLAFAIALIIANNVSRPIQKITAKARHLGKGDFDIHFDGKGYLEIEELNDTLNYAVQELGKVENLRNELIANMSHDLRTPLTMITGYSEAIRDLPGEDTKENIQIIIDECTRLTNLVNSILDLSKIQSRVEELKTEKFNLSEQVRTICERFDTLLKKDGYEIQYIQDTEEDVYVEADQEKISQVIYNIIGNAVHYTGEDKKIYVRQTCMNDIVRIEIEDTGKGIKEEDIPYVWDRYYKLKTNHKRQELGTGLGLSIVRGILELHAVRYGIISEKGKGANFYFEFPKVKE